MTQRIIWGNVNADGSIHSGSGDFAITRTDNGVYMIQFNDDFTTTPAIVASQVRWGDIGQKTADNVVFPFLNKNGATAITGDNSGNRTNRNFAFIAIGV
ncbi:hypothetical protein ACFSE1_15305 [Rhizobium helianthi]|uniref:Uncharacterized protein n=1 Tax=Rhizobium helianthi TaxID=1132695 RepID=A0ABW4M5Y5_9HYPH